jgi:hypothetical protein
MAKTPAKKAKNPLQRTSVRQLAEGLREELLRKLRDKVTQMEPRKPKKT